MTQKYRRYLLILIAVCGLFLVGSSSRVWAAEPATLMASRHTAGALGWAWGTRAEAFTDCQYVSRLSEQWMLYSTAQSMSYLTGDIESRTEPVLVVDEQQGLVQAKVIFTGGYYDMLAQRLTTVLGESQPVVYEIWAGREQLAGQITWLASEDTKVMLQRKKSVAVLTISKREVRQEAELEAAWNAFLDQWFSRSLSGTADNNLSSQAESEGGS